MNTCICCEWKIFLLLDVLCCIHLLIRITGKENKIRGKDFLLFPVNFISNSLVTTPFMMPLLLIRLRHWFSKLQKKMVWKLWVSWRLYSPVHPPSEIRKHKDHKERKTNLAKGEKWQCFVEVLKNDFITVGYS